MSTEQQEKAAGRGALEVELVAVDSLVEDPENARSHDEDNLTAIKTSLERFGQRKPIVVRRSNRTVIAGNGTFRCARALGWKEIYVAWTDLTDDEARAYSIVDNHSGDLSEWNVEELAKHLGHLGAIKADLTGFSFKPLFDILKEEDKPAFTMAVNIPQYEVVGEKPLIGELYDDGKTVELQSEVMAAADVPSDVKEFLIAAACRHTVFNYRKVAEYYAQATPSVQRLMERSVLVIIDLEDAIRNGYTRLTEAISQAEVEAEAEEEIKGGAA